MNYAFPRKLFLIPLLLLATSANAQVPVGGRGGPPAAAPTAPGSRTRGTPTDPRPSVEAAEARLREFNAEDLKQPPQRDYKIEMGEPQKEKLFRADPKLFENRFVATLVLGQHALPPQNVRSEDPRSRSDFPVAIEKLLRLDGSSRFANQPAPNLSISQIMKELAEHCAAEHLPETSVVNYLTSEEFDRNVRWSIGDSLSFRIYSPTVQEAEARVAAIIRLHDCGAIRPLQQFFYAEGSKQLLKARAGCDQIDKLTAEVRAEEEKIATPSEVSADILSQLKAQKIMVAVELAGLNARVKACDGMLSDPKKLEVSTLQSISDMKVKAEIERIGTKEKLDQIISFIAEGDKREAINVNILNLNSRRGIVQREVTNAANMAERYANLVLFHSPRPLKEGKVLISPVEWTEK